MSTAELLSMLTVHGVQIGKPFGGTPAITAQDVAGAMGMGHLPDEQGALLLAKYCLDKRSKHKLWAHWLLAVMHHARAEEWQTARGQLLTLTNLSLEEALEDHVCRVCDGVGELLIDDKKVVCERCDGTGRRFKADYRLAQEMGCGRTVFRSIWKPRMLWCRRELQVWEASGLSALAVSMS